MSWRKLKRIAAVLLSVTLVVLALGLVYETVGRRRDRERFPRIGHAVDIGGRTLNLHCLGEGTPTVVFDAGAGRSGYSWTEIQSEVARLTRACWFDRAGEGWSDPGPFPRTSAAIADDLHRLLHADGVPGPYVLVGHSFGGLTARVYTGLYPEEVAGLVLIEAAHEDEPARAPPMFVGPKPPRALWRPLHWAFMGAARVGLIRLMAPRVDTPTQTVDALARQPLFVATANSAGLVAPDSYAQARAAGDLDDRPLVVLTRGEPFGDGPELAAWFHTWVYELQAGLAALSSRGRQVIVPNCGHGIPEESPSAVVLAIEEVVGDVRARGNPP